MALIINRAIIFEYLLVTIFPDINLTSALYAMGHSWMITVRVRQSQILPHVGFKSVLLWLELHVHSRIEEAARVVFWLP